MKRAAQDQFDAFVHLHASRLLRTAYLLTGDWWLAEDLVQTALLKLSDRWASLRDPAAAEAYTKRAMVTTHLTWRRRRRCSEVVMSALPDAIAGISAETAVDNRDALRRALATLTPRQRTIVVLRFYEDMSELQVAELLGCSLGTVKSTACRALSTLRNVGEAALLGEVAV